MTERWLPVVGYENQYEVSDCGHVRSIDRWVPCNKSKRFVAGQLLSPRLRNGYPVVELFKKGKPVTHYVHRLMAEAFLGPCLSPKHEVNHKDADRGHCHVSNIEWVTRSRNQIHAIEMGRRPRVGGKPFKKGQPASGRPFQKGMTPWNKRIDESRVSDKFGQWLFVPKKTRRPEMPMMRFCGKH